MKYFLTISAFLSALVTLGVLILFISVLIAWINGGGNVFLPGLGLIIAAPLILAVLFIIGVIMLSLTVFLARRISRPLR
jgi:hypothetical protein